MRSALVCLVLGCVLLATGCQTTSPEPSTVESQKCYTSVDQKSGGPDLATPVDCGQPHSVEVQGAVDLPADFRTDTRDELLQGEKRAEYTSWSEDSCEQLWSETIGTGRIAEAAGLDASKDAVVPAFNGRLGYGLTSEDEWGRNIKKVMCYTSFSTDNGTKPAEVSSEASLNFFTPQYPLNLRQCVGENADNSLVPCDKPHYIETVFSFDPQAALGTDFVQAVNPDKPTAEQYRAITDVCTKAASAVFGADRQDLRLLGDFDRSTWNSDNSGSYAVFCSAYLAQGSDALLNGTVVGIGDAPLPTVQ